jgi:Kef-type K+ transport system membrane component KefB
MALPFVLGAGLGFALPRGLVPPTADPTLFALFLGVALSISAIPVAVRVLVDLDAFALPIGQVTVATAMFTDVVGWLALSVVAGVARSGTLDAALVGRTVAALAAFLGVAFAVGPRVADVAFARLRGSGDAGTIALGTLWAVGASALALAVGVEPAVGAFVAGLVVSRADAVGESSVEALESVTFGFFAPVFFGAAGLRADLGLLFDPTVAAVGTATLVVADVGKFVGAYVGGTAAGYSRAEAAVLGSGLNARGAVEIAVAAVGLELGILGRGMYTVVVGVAVLTSAMTPPLLRATLRRLPRPADGGARPGAGSETRRP